MKKIFSIAAVVVVFLVSFLVFRATKQTPTATVTIRNQHFTVEVADTDAKRIQGLSGRDGLKDSDGMLFVFDQPNMLTFWMKGMKFPIDIIFIKDDRIVTIHENIPNPSPNTLVDNLPRYSSSERANYVLEINAGLSRKYGLRKGDTVEIKE